jgi:Ca-activated chloride channel family protein
VLLTDGANNAGSIDPTQAAALAKAKGIPVYTIGAGQEGAVPMPLFDNSGRKLGYQTVLSDLDERTLADVADRTGGRYFRAMDSGTVDAAFAAIDRERKLEFDAQSSVRAQEFYELAAWPGFGIFAIGFWLARPGRWEGQS